MFHVNPDIYFTNFNEVLLPKVSTILVETLVETRLYPEVPNLAFLFHLHHLLSVPFCTTTIVPFTRMNDVQERGGEEADTAGDGLPAPYHHCHAPLSRGV